MLHSLNSLRDFAIAATDGEAGKVIDVYFDEKAWVMRFLVIDTGGWFAGRTVVISPVSVCQTDWRGRVMRLSLATQQIKDSLEADAAKPVSRQKAGRMPHWSFDMTLGIVEIDPREDTDRLPRNECETQNEEGNDPYLRSAKEVVGYAIQGFDGAVGQATDFLLEDEEWSLPLMVVDTRKWWPGTDVLVPTKNIAHINYYHSSIVVNMTRDEIKNCASYDALNLK